MVKTTDSSVVTEARAGLAVTNDEFERLALADDERDRQWELVEGRLRKKPGMSAVHNRAIMSLAYQLMSQLDRSAYDVRANAGHVHRPTRSYFIPDVLVAPAALVLPRLSLDRLEVFPEPLPLVVEVWSPSTGRYDSTTKLPAYRARGDAEIWRLHPRARTLTVWRRQPDGTYVETEYQGGMVSVTSLPNVVVDLDSLFD